MAGVRFKNFSIWRRRLPHWRADGVTYFVTFRHSRPLSESERRCLLDAILQTHGRKLDYLIACVLPERTEAMFRVEQALDGRPIEFAKVIEGAKRKAGKRIIGATGERFAPFWEESYDRIVRDESELEERWLAMLEAPVQFELAEDPEAYDGLWVAGAVDDPPLHR